MFVAYAKPTTRFGMTLGKHFEPEPDLALVRRSEGHAGVPIPEEVLLVVEVAYTSLTYDRETKLPLYAEADIPEARIVDDLTTDAIEATRNRGREAMEESPASSVENGELNYLGRSHLRCCRVPDVRRVRRFF